MRIPTPNLNEALSPMLSVFEGRRIYKTKIKIKIKVKTIKSKLKTKKFDRENSPMVLGSDATAHRISHSSAEIQQLLNPCVHGVPVVRPEVPVDLRGVR